MIKQLNRLFALYRITTFLEFLLLIIHQFFKAKVTKSFVPLHRLLIFAISCSDHHIQISNYSDELLLLSWKEDGTPMRFFVRKYSRDLLVFTEFFIDKEFFRYIKLLKTSPLEKINYIIDAGANIGCSVLFFHLYFPEANIICIEPEESNYILLNKNIHLNNPTSQIITIQKALWNEITELDLMQRDWSHDGFHVMQKSTPDEVISKTATTTIPQLIKDFGYNQIDLLKIDIEGAEKAIFNDKLHLDLFLTRIRHLIIDVHEEFISEQKISEVLENFNFECEKVFITGQPTVVIANMKLPLTNGKPTMTIK